MNHPNKIKKTRPLAALVSILALLACGCAHLDLPGGPLAPAPPTGEAAAVYALACTGMETAGNIDEFAAALSALDDQTGLDFSGENPQDLIRALRRGAALMSGADSQAKKAAAAARSREKKLNQKIRGLKQEVKMLRHQIAVLENIEQERQEKRKTQ